MTKCLSKSERDWTPFFALLTSLIFAVELYANVRHLTGAVALSHLIIVGAIELFLVAYLVIKSAKFVSRHLPLVFNGGRGR